MPLRVETTSNPTELKISWEDIREDAMQPQNDGSSATGLGREYTLWRGVIGAWLSHAVVDDGIAGTEVNGAVRSASIPVEEGQDSYFLVSGRSDNHEGTLGSGAAGERPGFAVLDICETLGDFSPESSWATFSCGRDFELVDTHGKTRHLHEFRGKAVLLDFSAEWCPPCQLEANALENIWQDYKDRGVEFISVIMDEEILGQDWDGRPTPAECRIWEIRTPDLNHTFHCWADPVHCTGSPCSGDRWQAAYPLYNHFGGLPYNVILNQGLGVTFSMTDWSETVFRDELDKLVGSTNRCLH
jgi:thiol-disulfide isomerase/thioredoxin